MVGNLIESSLSDVASLVDNGKLLKEKNCLLKKNKTKTKQKNITKRHGVRMHVGMLKRKLKNRPRKIRPVRRCFVSTFTLITCRSFIILNSIYARKANPIQVRKLCKI